MKDFRYFLYQMLYYGSNQSIQSGWIMHITTYVLDDFWKGMLRYKEQTYKELALIC